MVVRMKEVRDQATFSSHADLLMDDNQLSAFGVRSKWVQDDGYDSEGSLRPRRRNKRYTRLLDVDDDRRGRTRDRPRSTANRSQTASQAETVKGVRPPKRNERLSEIQSRQKQVKDSSLPSPPEPGEKGVCPYCFERSPAFQHERHLKTHWAQRCPCVGKCDFCDKLIESSDLAEHQLGRCEFVEDNLEPCALCGLPIDKGEESHPKCKESYPPSGGAWCPLCAALVQPAHTKQAWQKHLIRDCLNNPRNKRWREKPGTNPTHLLTSLSRLASRGGSANQPRATSRATPTASAVPATAMPATSAQRLTPNVSHSAPTVPANGNGVGTEQIRAAFSKIKEDRRAQYLQQERAKQGSVSSEEDF